MLVDYANIIRVRQMRVVFKSSLKYDIDT
jgi:hypothetical protein